MVSDQILYPALRLAGVLTAAGRTASASQMADAFGALNRMVESWTNQRLLIYTIGAARYTLTPSQPSYTIGPGADFDAPRPVRITAANLVLTGSGNEVHIPLAILTDRQWAAKRLPVLPSTLPTQLYNDGAYPVSTLYLWPNPTEANDLELYTWSRLMAFGGQSDPVAFPPGYEDAIVHSLAVRLCALFRTQCPTELYRLATESRAVIKGSNAASPAIPSADYGAQGRRGLRGLFNYFTGTDK